MSEFYKRETKVQYYIPELDVIEEGIVDEVYANEEGGVEYSILTKEGEFELMDEVFIGKDKKTLLLRILDNAEKNARWHKQRMFYFNERADKICRILEELDKSINIKQELENYRKENKNG